MQYIIDDLLKSGLSVEDLGVKALSPPECAAINVPVGTEGYVIPYYNIQGGRVPFYRARLFGHVNSQGAPVKYKQLTGSGNHLYFPPTFYAVLLKFTKKRIFRGNSPFVVITEGEKKAAACCKLGIPALAVSGVDSWKNRNILVPTASEFIKSGKFKEVTQIRLPQGDQTVGEAPTLAEGLSEVIELLIQFKCTLLIIYDTDGGNQKALEGVQRAATRLGHTLIHKGIPLPNVKQIILPNNPTDPKIKVGLDDYLVAEGKEGLYGLVNDVFKQRNAFPKHSNAKGFITSRLYQSNLTRREAIETSLSIIGELDVRGRRLLSEIDSTPFYFDERTHKLMPANLMIQNEEALHISAFGNLLYNEFGLGAPDNRVLKWVATQFTGEAPIEKVVPKKLMAIPPDSLDELAIQISDSHYALISGNPDKPLQIMTNGTNGLLFEQGHVENLNEDDVALEFKEQMSEPFHPKWLDVFNKDVNVGGDDSGPMLMALLHYISPYLLRWRGTQLPIELVIGEAGSGKSSLYSLRLSILTGNPLLRNIPVDLKDWFASITNVGGLHVIDNVQFTNRDLRQRISDEICRIITESRPHVEMRRLYTTSGSVKIPVETVFAMTAIQQPFQNSDLLQRSAIFELNAVGGGHKSDWVQDRLSSFGGRTGGLVHQMVFLHKFFREVRKGNWDEDYRAKHRLANYEQILMMAAGICGLSSAWIPDALVSRTQIKITEADWALDALKEYVDQLIIARKYVEFGAKEISKWAMSHAEHYNNQMLISSRSMGKYIGANQTTIEKITGSTYIGKVNNRKMFAINLDAKK